MLDFPIMLLLSFIYFIFMQPQIKDKKLNLIYNIHAIIFFKY